MNMTNDDEPTTRGAGGTPGGIAEFFIGLVMVLAGGIGLIVRAIAPHASKSSPIHRV